MTRLLIVGVITSAALIIAILALIRTRKLQERYAILWLIAASGVVVFGLWTAALEGLAKALGIAYPPNALFLLGALFAIGVLLHTAVVITRLSNQTQTLAQRLAMAEERLRQLEQRVGPDALEDPGGEDASVEKVLRGAPQVTRGRRRFPRLARSRD